MNKGQLTDYLDQAKLDQMDQTIRQAQTIAIAAHKNPDGDAYGSVLGLGQVLRAMGKEVDMLAFEKVNHLSYIPHLDLLTEGKEEKTYDLFVLLDLGDKPRMGEAIHAFERSKHSLCFDHHMTNEKICDINLVMPDASSTCEVLTLFLDQYGYEINQDAATSLYVGLITDSNRFLYDTARSRAMRVGARLIDLGADVDWVYLNEYNADDPKVLAFTGKIIRDADFLQDGKVALCALRKDEAKEYGLAVKDVDMMVDSLRSLAGVEVACQVREESQEESKVSFRSKSYFNVADLAIQLGGGGHKKASGATIKGSVDQVYGQMKKLLQEIEV